MLRLILSCIISFICIGISPHAIAQVTPYFVSVSNGAYSSFDASNTQVKVWINTKNEDFHDISPESQLDLVDQQSGTSLSNLAKELKSAYRKESASLQKRGVFRSNPNMAEGSPDLSVETLGPAKDTSGFVIKLYTVAVPPSGCRALLLKGELLYTIASPEAYEISMEIENIASLLGDKSILTGQGDTLSLEKTEGEEEDYYVAKLTGHLVLGLGRNGQMATFNELALKKEEAQEKMTVNLKVKKLIKKSILLEKTVSLGIGY